MAKHKETSPDHALIERVLAGEHDAFGVLIERYYRIVLGLCLARTNTREDAEDAAQETFLRAFESLPQLRNPKRFGPWIVTIAKNACNSIRARNKRVEAERAADTIASASLAEEVEERELRDTIREQVQRVPHPYREALVLHYLAGKKTREISQLLNVSWVSIRKRLQRGRELLGQRMAVELKQNFLTDKDERKQAEKIFGALPLLYLRPESAAPMHPPAGTRGPMRFLPLGKPIIWMPAAVLFTVAAIVVFQFSREYQQPSIEPEPPEAVTTLEVGSGKDATSAEESTDSRTAMLSGTVRYEDGHPASSARVTAERVDMAEVGQQFREQGQYPTLHKSEIASGEDGHYAFYDLPAGPYVITASREDGLAVADAFVQERSPATMDLTLLAAQPVSGHVLDMRGNPVEGAIVFPANQETGAGIHGNHGFALRAVSDDKGRFEFPALWADRWSLFVQAKEHASELTPFLELAHEDAVVTLGSGRRIKGSVKRLKDKTPVPGVAVSATSGIYWQEFNKTTTQGDGTFVLLHLSPGDYVFVSIADDRYAESGGGAQWINIPDRADVSGCDFLVADAASVSGQVRLAGKNTPLSNVVVSAVYVQDSTYTSPGPSGLGPNNNATTGANGRFRIGGLGPGIYDFFVMGTGAFPSNSCRKWLRVRLQEGEQRRGISIDVDQGKRLAGCLRDEAGHPVPYASVQCFDADHWDPYTPLQSDADGSFELYVLPSCERAYVMASRDDLISACSGPFSPGGEDPAPITLTLRPAARIRGQLVDGQGRPLGGWSVIADDQNLYADRAIYGWPTTETGHFEGMLPAGTYTINYSAPGAGSWNFEVLKTLTLAPGDIESNLLLRLDERFAISGVVTDAEGEPLHSARVLAAGSHRTSASSGLDGHFTVEGLKSGIYSIWVSHAGFKTTHINGIRAGTTDVAIALEKGSQICGRVLSDDSGMPITSFQAQLVYGATNSMADIGTGQFAEFNGPQGAFSFDSPNPESSQTLAIQAHGFQTAFVPLPPLESGQVTEEIVVRLEKGQTLRGRVVTNSGDPLPQAHVFAGRLPEQLKGQLSTVPESDENGLFELDALPEGPSPITVFHPDYAPKAIIVDPSQNNAMLVEIALEDAHFVEGAVSLDGDAVGGAFVRYRYDSPAGLVRGGVRTDAAGEYQMGPLPAAKITCLIDVLTGRTESADNPRFLRQIDTPAAERLQIHFDVPKSDAILDVLVVHEGEPVTALQVPYQMLTEQGWLIGLPTTDDFGRLRIRNLPEGVLTLRIEHGQSGEAGPCAVAIPIKRDIHTAQTVELTEIECTGTWEEMADQRLYF